MKFDDLDFDESDDGITTDVVLESFNNQEVELIYLESSVVDDKLRRDVEFVILNQKKIYKLICDEMSSMQGGAKNNLGLGFELMTVYFFPDIENEYGFLFSWRADTEHGLGVRFNGMTIKKIGSAEVAFL